MKTKNFMLTIIGMFALVLVMGLGSAAELNGVSVSVDVTTLNDVSPGETYDFAVNVANANGTDLYFDFGTTGWTWKDSSDTEVTTRQLIANGADAGYTATLTIPSSGNKNVIVNAYPDETSDEIFDIYELITLNYADVEVYGCTDSSANNYDPDATIDDGSCIYDSFCELGSFITDEDGDAITNGLNDLELEVDISNSGDEDLEWKALDNVQVDVTFTNNFDEDGDMDLKDVTFELGLFKKSEMTNLEEAKNYAKDLIWISDDEEKSKDTNVDEDEDTTYTFEFRVDPDLDEDDYVLMVKAYNDEDGTDKKKSFCLDYSDNLDEEYYTPISITKESDSEKVLVVDTDSLGVLEASCEGTLTINADVWNIGEDKIEDNFMINLYNKELGINIDQAIEADLKSGKSTEVAFDVEIPAGLEEKTYVLKFTTYYDYDEDDGAIDEAKAYSEKSDETFDVPLSISGNCEVAKAELSATLSEGGKAGEQMIVKATIVNSGSQKTTYNLNVAGYTDWANSANLDSTQVTLDAEESREVAITLDVKKETSGDKIFNLEVTSDGELVATQPVQVSVEPKSVLSLTNGGMASILIGAISVILVIIIIVLAVRVARK